MSVNIAVSVKGSNEVLYLQAPIKFLSNEIFTGYNTFHSSSVICQHIDFGPLANVSSSDVGQAFVSAFLERFLALKSFVPQNGLTDEFLTQLRSPAGVNFERVLLEAIIMVETATACTMHDLDTIAYAAIEKQQDSTALIWESAAPKLSRLAANVALLGVLELLPKRLYASSYNNPQHFDEMWQELQTLAKRRRLAASTATIKLAAKKRGLTCDVVGRQHLRLGQGQNQRQIYASMTSTTSSAAQKVCSDKRLTNRRLRELRLPVPKQIKVATADAARAAVVKLGFPVVVKPLKGSRGEGVTAGVTDLAGVITAFELAHKSGSDVLVEQYVQGTDHRLLVIGGRFVAGLTRRPPTIVGDGHNTVATLIDQLNDDPYRDGFRRYQVKHDDEIERLLRQEGTSMNTVLRKDHSIALRTTANVSTGGVPIDVTDQVHPDNREMAERAAKGVGLDVAGVDFMTTDISRSYRETGGALIELNARPGLCIHTWPEQGKPRNVAGDLLSLSFPKGADGCIPVAAIAGDKGTGAVARYLDAILRRANKSVALALRENAYVNGESAELTQKQQEKAALTLLRDPEIDTLISTVSLRQTAKRGLLLERCSLTVIMNKTVAGDTKLFHKGLDVVEKATKECFVVDSGNIVALGRLSSSQTQRKLILVSDHFNDAVLQNHLNAGHTAVTTIWQDGKSRIALLSGSEVLASFSQELGSTRDGKIKKRRLKNGKMFAIAAAYGLGLSASQIVTCVENLDDIN
jgi:cyanophycin synthetase